jgi:hypothetical protein
MTVIQDAGHLPNLERPAAFNEAALWFLLKQEKKFEPVRLNNSN